MKKTILLVLAPFLLAGILTACTHETSKQQSAPAASASSGISSTVSSDAAAEGNTPAAASPGSSGAASAAAGSGSSKKAVSAQDQELQDLLDNLNGIGNSAGGLDEPTSSDLELPAN